MRQQKCLCFLVDIFRLSQGKAAAGEFSVLALRCGLETECVKFIESPGDGVRDKQRHKVFIVFWKKKIMLVLEADRGSAFFS